MTVFTANAEEGADAAAITAASSGFTSVASGTGSTATYASAAACHGVRGYRLANASTTTNVLRYDGLSGTATKTVRVRCMVRISALPASGQFPQLLYVTDSTNSVIIAVVALNTSGNLVVQAPSGTTVFTSTLALAVNTWYRIELVLTVGTTTSNGIFGIGCVAGDTALAATNSSTNAYFYSTTANLGTAGVGRISLGKMSATWAATEDLDDYRADDTAGFTSAPSTWIGPATQQSAGTLSQSGSGSLSFGLGFPAITEGGPLQQSGSGSLSFAPTGQTASGLLARTGSGSLSFGTVGQSASGSLSASGSGSLSFGGGTVGYRGTLATSGSGSLSLGAIGQVASGALAQTGSGSLSMGSTIGTGLLATTGSGALSLSGKPVLSGALALSGSGVLALPGTPRPAGLLARTGSGQLTMTAGGITTRVKAWNGTGWVPTVVKVWDGAAWVVGRVRIWTGSAWA